MDRFVVFGYREFYPVGGLNDAIASFPSKKEAVEFAEEKMAVRAAFRMLCCHIFDCDERREVWRKSKET